ncbi:SDR family oxidoreductase [Glaciihabitans arcticus]|uniref:SDR family oxidoreductase n=1 Tax=Glaciihabitans arcticus TaxID=2668039 RepID=UPI001959D353|nr:NAD(P)H-binding protein [Glaciihabitans arcticus]
MTTGAILVTGGTGTLGRDLVPMLRDRGADVTVLSRRAAPGVRVADLASGAGLADALDGISTVVHLAAGKRQAEEAQRLVSACEAAGIQHLVFISIVGIDAIPYPY